MKILIEILANKLIPACVTSVTLPERRHHTAGNEYEGSHGRSIPDAGKAIVYRHRASAASP